MDPARVWGAVLISFGLLATAWAQTPKPLLYGVIYGERGWVAYIEDPSTKVVTPCRVGDTVAGQTVLAIEDERVVLKGAAGTLEIRLSDDKPGVSRPPAVR